MIDDAIQLVMRRHDEWLERAKITLHRSAQRQAAEMAQELFEVVVELRRLKEA